MPWPDAALLPAPDGFQAAEPPRAAPPATAVQRNVVSGGTAVQRNAGSGAMAVRRYAAPNVAAWPVVATWPGDGMPAQRDAPWLAAPPDGPWPVVLLAELPALRPHRVVRPFRVPGRVLGRTH
ncbi:hypothetical protein LRP30_12135 [Bradyrhizobium sp. C-145]|uniref:hypothetical protein n=1 Tax=Bradyrhizobium sp. C-145 TaxID=574727 RepID=UPI00201B757D|nr:hypothetical protein [Bradyrhizobium sp. C-145]UQR65940.1 hypothetical protein LRP30_12135 [Bradyrhizobium sp. C-145]